MAKNRTNEYTGFIIAGIISFLIFFSFYPIAFPEASIDIGITNTDAKEISKNFLLLRNFDITGYEESVIFSSFGDAVIYLEKTMGIEKANEIMRNDIDLWFFKTRFFMPLLKTEYSVLVSPKDGSVIGFEQDILDEDSGAELELDEAKGIAVDFLDSMGIDTDEFDLIYFSSEERKNRVDHYFKWEKKDYYAANATYRISVSVYGDYIGYYSKYLYVPESFLRDYQNERSYGVVLTLVSYVFMIILVIMSIWTFIVMYKKNEIKMKFALYLAIIVGVLVVADMVNSLPLVFSSYPTTITKNVFFATLFFSTVIGAIIYMMIIVMSGASGEVLSRKVLMKKSYEVTDFLRNRTGRDFTGSAIRGYGLGFFFLAYITMFYLVGRNFFEIWIPADAGYSNMFNLFFPFLYPLTIGVLAAVSEEFLFRFFGIPVIKKYTKSLFLALFIPAVIWAFGHSTYAVFPVYARGVELTIAGLIFGYMFVRYDIMTVLIAHYVIDAVLVSMPLLRSSNTYYFVSGIVVAGLMLVPALFAVASAFKKRPQG